MKSGTVRAAAAAALIYAPLLAQAQLPALLSKDYEAKSFGPARWLDEGAAYTTVEDSAAVKGAKDIVRYQTVTGARSVLVSASQLIPAGEKQALGIDDYEWSKDRKQLLIYANAQKVWRRKTRGDYWLLDLQGGGLKKLGGTAARPATLMFASFSPDGKRVAYLRRDLDVTQMATNLYVEDLATAAVTALTNDAELRRSDGTGQTVINGTGDWVHEEEYNLRKGYEWSPDGRHIAYWQFDATAVKDFYLINNTATLYPVITPIPYPKTGTANSTVRVGIVNADGGATRWLDLGADPSNFYVPRMVWTKDSSELFLQRFDRPQQHLDLLAAEVASGTVRTVLQEKASTWIDVVDDFKWLNKGREFLWVSERDGWRHVYAVPRAGGAPRLLTPGEYDVTAVAGVDEKRGALYVIASPDNATQRYLYRVPLASASSTLQRITPASARGTHSYDVSPDGRWAFHTSSTIDSPPDTALVSLPDHGERRMLLDNQALRSKIAPLFNAPTEFFSISIPKAESPGEKAVLDAWMLKPPGFDPAKKYPVLVYVYSEPGSQTVLDRWRDKMMYFHRHIASQGYVVISIDNRGTPAPKGSNWRHIVYGAIGVLAADEQAAALRAVLAERPYLDSNRVAVWGWSGGGSMTLHLMFRYPDLYKVGMSVAAVPDQRYYDTIYQERYMGTPQGNPDGYKRGSPINYAEGLKGELLIAGGTGDDNCHYQMIELMLNRLIELGKPFHFMSYPNRSHSIDEGEGTLLHLYSTLSGI